MFSQTWKKYLPVIIILMKRADIEEQSLTMNASDFLRAAGGRKPRLSFTNVQLNNGKINSLIFTPPIATDLLLALQENDASKRIIRERKFEFSLNTSFQLTIRNTAPAPLAAQESSENNAEEGEKKSSD
jgi:hypothetical protein